MKKIVGFISMAIIMLSLSVSVFAGDVPEALLDQDDAQVFIGTVGKTTLGSENPLSSQVFIQTAEVTPTEAIKGDVEVGIPKTYNHCDFGSFIPEKDTEYLFGYIDENNFYIYEIESRNEDVIKLVGSNEFDMTKRLENYLNEGAFAMAEQERATLGEQISLMEYLYKMPSYSSLNAQKVTLRYQDDLIDVELDEFLKIAQDIMVTNVKNEPLHNKDMEGAYKTVLYIELLDEYEQNVAYAAVTELGEVDRNSLWMSRLMSKDCEMNPDDLQKLYSFFPDGTGPKANHNNYADGTDTDLILVGIIVCLFIVLAVLIVVMKKKRKKANI